MKSVITACITALSLVAAAVPAKAQSQSEEPDARILLTVVLKHDQSMTLEEIQAHLADTDFWSRFPPEGIDVDSWYVMMGLGQVVTFRVPPARLREVNRTIEQTAWGAFRTEIYATYDLSSVAAEFREEAQIRQDS